MENKDQIESVMAKFNLSDEDWDSTPVRVKDALLVATNQLDAFHSAAIRLKVGLSQKSQAGCEWYEGIQEDAIDEILRALSMNN